VVEQLGERFVRALAEKDAAVLKQVLRPDLDFRAMTPGSFWEATEVDTIVDETMLGQWFSPQDRITEVLELEHGCVGARARVRYRFKVVSPDGSYLVEQLAYYETVDDRISWLRIICSGYLPAD